jgi:hypothetical protein
MYLGNGSVANQSSRIIVAEIDTNGTVVTAVRVRPYNGYYDSGYTNTLVGIAGVYTKNHNFGTKEISFDEVIECITAEAGYSVGDVLLNPPSSVTSYEVKPSIKANSNTILVRRSTSSAYGGLNATSGAAVAFTAANWKYKITARRKF